MLFLERDPLRDFLRFLEKQIGKNVFLISDPGLKKVGLVDRAAKIIQNAGLQYTEFLELQPNPTVHNVTEAVKAFKASDAESIIALGGGGPMDVAKQPAYWLHTAEPSLIMLVWKNGFRFCGPHDCHSHHRWDWKARSPLPPVITDSETNFKMSIISHYLIPQYALLDPDLIMTLPASYCRGLRCGRLYPCDGGISVKDG